MLPLDKERPADLCGSAALGLYSCSRKEPLEIRVAHDSQAKPSQALSRGGRYHFEYQKNRKKLGRSAAPEDDERLSCSRKTTEEEEEEEYLRTRTGDRRPESREKFGADSSFPKDGKGWVRVLPRQHAEEENIVLLVIHHDV